MCRDRHLLIGGNIPNFWDLDNAFTSRIRFYYYVPTRGVAWIFEQEINPFTNDPWNAQLNKKAFRKNNGRPYSLPNFLCEIQFPDWTPTEKKKYYEIRNKKRVMAVDENKDIKRERYKDIIKQRDNLIFFILNYNDKIRENPKNIIKITHKALAEVTGLTREAITMLVTIRNK